MDIDQLLSTFAYILLGDFPEETTVESVRQLVRDSTNEWLQNVENNDIDVISCKQTILELKTLPVSDSYPVQLIRHEFLGVLETFLSDEKGVSVH